jgi:glycosyltransferase involved in cell wall biosynthesis
VTQEQLCAIYSAAQALIFPSFYEGFGWPIIEAQACGCPVFTSNRAPMTEVGGTAAIYFDPLDEEKAAECVAKNLRDTKMIVESGFDNIQRFYFSCFKGKYESVYQSVWQKYLQRVY